MMPRDLLTAFRAKARQETGPKFAVNGGDCSPPIVLRRLIREYVADGEVRPEPTSPNLEVSVSVPSGEGGR